MAVVLVGAGPGDLGLLTLKGYEAVKNADVVLYDRFVGEDILALMPREAELINVGKNAGNHPVPQDEINRLLLDRGLQGLNVVRLKGGDPYVFGRGGEELELLIEHNVPFEVVPGITSAIAGPAYAGIPVTHRNYASSFHVVTGHGKNNEPTNIDYSALAGAKGTLVFLMGVGALASICDGCLKAGMDPGRPAAVVENATTPKQRKVEGTLSTLPSLAASHNIASPALIIVGEVSSLSGRYDWFSKRPLFGKRVAVGRATPGASKLALRLKELGCETIELAPARFAPNPNGLDRAFAGINSYSWVAFTSATGVDTFFESLAQRRIDIRTLAHLKVACVGSQTEKAVEKWGLFADYCPSVFNGAALGKGLSGLAKPGEKVLLARAKDAGSDLPGILAAHGVEFDDIPIYEKAYSGGDADIGAIDYAAFTSSSAVDWFAQNAAGVDLASLDAVCIGESTAAKARSYGINAILSDEATIEGVAEKIKELCVWKSGQEGFAQATS